MRSFSRPGSIEKIPGGKNELEFKLEFSSDLLM